ncbi:Transcription factor [Arachis hypogaea]|nr:Transcription factor [Arachis hypogaea]
MGSSPQSTLSEIESWSGRSLVSGKGTPNGSSRVPSPSTTPFADQNDPWEVIYQAAGQVARMKLNDHVSQSNRGFLNSACATAAAPKNLHTTVCRSFCNHDPQVSQEQVLNQQCGFTWGRQGAGSFENLQNKLSDLIERPNLNNFSWNYAIFWQFSQSKFKKDCVVLSWGDDCCREPIEGEEEREALRLRFDDDEEKNENYAFGLDRVTDIEMFFLASMYFSFPKGYGGSGNFFELGKHLWICNDDDADDRGVTGGG